MLRKVAVEFRGVAPYSQSRVHEAPRLPKEGPDAYELRTWPEKGHYDKQGMLCIPAMALKQSVDRAAQILSIGIPGKGKSTYTKHVIAGTLVESNICLNIKKETIESVRIHANSDGKRGGSKRVWRYFPEVYEWKGVASFMVLDDALTSEVFEQIVREAGRFVGIGRFRPEKGGTNGRFEIIKFTWSEISV